MKPGHTCLMPTMLKGKYDVFLYIFLYYFNLGVPLLKCRQKFNSKKWMTQYIVNTKLELKG